jgi:hypothetical protein
MIYTIELLRWNISNDGTNPIPTTKGINDALAWAYSQGYETVKLPAGEYLIDKDSYIQMVNDTHFLLDEKAVVRKQANSYPEYKTLYIGPFVKNVTISGGTFIGDRAQHDFSTGGTHEFGYGIITEGGINLVIDRVTIHDFTGDGVFIGGQDQYVNTLFQADFAQGGIDDNGKLIADPNTIRSISSKLSVSGNAILQTRRLFQLARQQNLASEFFNAYFYKADGTFLSSVKNARFVFSEVPIPADASYFYITVPNVGTTGVQVGLYAQALAKRVIVQNCDIFNNRRQGISVVGAWHVLIDNSVIHDINGTSPQSGIDLEGGFFPNSEVRITNNTFYRNTAYDVILFDGMDILVQGNWMGSQGGAIGLAASKARYYQVIGNTFDRTPIYADGQDGRLEDNTVIGEEVNVYGTNITVDGITLYNNTLTVKTTVPYGAALMNARLVNATLSIQNNPVHVANVDIVRGTVLGTVSNGACTFDNLTVSNYDSKRGINLPQGIYHGCTFQYGPDTDVGWYGASVQQPGKYTLNGCSFRMKTTALDIGHPDAEVILQNCTFDIDADIGYGKAALYIRAAKSVEADNNVINANQITATNVALIKVNEYGAGTRPFDVASVVLLGNSVHANIAASGISTVEAGTGAPGYIVANNLLTNCTLNLKANDWNVNNLVL